MNKAERNRMKRSKKANQQELLYFSHVISCVLTFLLFQNDIYFLHLQDKPEFRCNNINTNQNLCVWMEYLQHWGTYVAFLVCWLCSGFKIDSILFTSGSRVQPVQLFQITIGGIIIIFRLFLFLTCFQPQFLSCFCSLKKFMKPGKKL